MDVEPISDVVCELAEGPLWNPRQQCLHWTDIPAGRVWRYDRRTQQTYLFRQVDAFVGGLAFTQADGLLMFTNKGVLLAAADGRLSRVLDVPMAADERFNDVTTDPKGRVFAGTLTERRRDGVLYRLEPGRPPVPVLKGLQTSNGMTFSLDLRHFFHTDSRPRTITRYEYDAATGEISNASVFYHGDARDGSPDGITLDAEGFMWVACYRGGKVVRLDPQGRIEREVALPTKNVSSVMFGGGQLDELYATTARADNGGTAEGIAGRVFRVKPGVRGRPEWPADAGWDGLTVSEC